MRARKFQLYLLSVILALFSCNNKFFSKQSNPTIFLSTNGLDGRDTLILYENGYFVYNDREAFSGGSWSRLNHKMLVLNSNYDISMNKCYNKEKIDTFKIQNGNDSSYLYFNKFVFTKFTKDTCKIINNNILQLEYSKYYKLTNY